jgi:hypothetical protein
VKIDIEGGEAEVFPAISDRLHELGCPVVLSLHCQWIADRAGLDTALATWDTETIDSTDPAFPTLVLR